MEHYRVIYFCFFIGESIFFSTMTFYHLDFKAQ